MFLRFPSWNRPVPSGHPANRTCRPQFLSSRLPVPFLHLPIPVLYSLTKIDEEIAQVDAEIAQTDTEMAQIDGEIAGLDEQIRVFQATIEYAGQYSDQTVEYVQASLDYSFKPAFTFSRFSSIIPSGFLISSFISSKLKHDGQFRGDLHEYKREPGYPFDDTKADRVFHRGCIR